MPKSRKLAKKKNNPRVVLDTNVLVAGLLNPDGPPGQILIALGYRQILYSLILLQEYKTVLHRTQFCFEASIIADILEFVVSEGEYVEPQIHLDICKHKNDNRFLECALFGYAGYLITGNLKDFPTPQYKHVKILSPRQFADLL